MPKEAQSRVGVPMLTRKKDELYGIAFEPADECSLKVHVNVLGRRLTVLAWMKVNILKKYFMKNDKKLLIVGTVK